MNYLKCIKLKCLFFPLFHWFHHGFSQWHRPLKVDSLLSHPLIAIFVYMNFIDIFQFVFFSVPLLPSISPAIFIAQKKKWQKAILSLAWNFWKIKLFLNILFCKWSPFHIICNGFTIYLSNVILCFDISNHCFRDLSFRNFTESVEIKEFI